MKFNYKSQSYFIKEKCQSKIFFPDYFKCMFIPLVPINSYIKSINMSSIRNSLCFYLKCFFFFYLNIVEDISQNFYKYITQLTVNLDNTDVIFQTFFFIMHRLLMSDSNQNKFYVPRLFIEKILLMYAYLYIHSNFNFIIFNKHLQISVHSDIFKTQTNLWSRN